MLNLFASVAAGGSSTPLTTSSLIMVGELVAAAVFVTIVIKLSLVEDRRDGEGKHSSLAGAVRAHQSKDIERDLSDGSVDLGIGELDASASTAIISISLEKREPHENIAAISESSPTETLKSKSSIFSGLLKTRDLLSSALGRFFKESAKGSEDDLAEILIANDFGPALSMELAERITADPEYREASDKELIAKDIFRSYISEILSRAKPGTDLLLPKLLSLESSSLVTSHSTKKDRPHVILMVGVNGVGKTTTCAKIASLASSRGLKSLIVAGDTFRAAASEQLEIWGERVNVEVFKSDGEKPSAVSYKGIAKGIDDNCDLIIVDTAGRLHNRTELMDELKSISVAIAKSFQSKGFEGVGVDEAYLVVDGTTGQNAVVQGEKFNEITELTGVIVTKLDGTSKGGVIVPLVQKLIKPVVAVGVGEKAEDLLPFAQSEYVAGLF